MMFLFHNQENKPLKAGRGTEKPMQSYRILRDQAIKGKEVTKRKLLQEPLKEEVKVAWTREQQRQEEKQTRGVQTVVRSHRVYRYGQDMSYEDQNNHVQFLGSLLNQFTKLNLKMFLQ